MLDINTKLFLTNLLQNAHVQLTDIPDIKITFPLTLMKSALRLSREAQMQITL